MLITKRIAVTLTRKAYCLAGVPFHLRVDANIQHLPPLRATVYTQVIELPKIVGKPHPALLGIPHARCYGRHVMFLCFPPKAAKSSQRRAKSCLSGEQRWIHRNALALLIKEREKF
ncbi:hypothetical protein DP113_13360 [Brasilonema octagenarum UFV-E1]|uniref:Uncharacterized protein n=1 Tax=Brasilonema sennae CENA114 TaxID=415709 RepID=A0A856MIF0_9CYAN|nr:hypothetical protein DP114_13415 [Brasilonema sennae CENA114]QDL15114.1 hypothetical protein DP113_13360 [Brasilonema octagenarum UFV-E1]